MLFTLIPFLDVCFAPTVSLCLLDSKEKMRSVVDPQQEVKVLHDNTNSTLLFCVYNGQDGNNKITCVDDVVV